MTAAEGILVLGHRGLLGRAVVEAVGPDCQVIEGGRAALDLGRMGAQPTRPAAGSAPADPPGAEEAAMALDRVRENLAGLGPAAADLHPNLELLEALLASGGVGLVVNCAGYTDVDRAEREPELAMAANAQGAGAVARLCARFGAHLVHLSTDYVFDGQAQGRPYREDDEPRPLSVYGRSKFVGERLVREAHPAALVVRSAWLFGPGRDNFVSKVLAAARAGRPLRVVRDQAGSPTYTRDLAPALIGLGRRRVRGLLHLVNRGQASRYELARQALALAGLDPEAVEPILTADLDPAAPRPAWSVLDTHRSARLMGGPLPDWLGALGRYINAEEVAA
ncbi:MAG: dTDP-4-dehydrorhamnose reductase [Thermodesulfobacteriota bacterium]